MSKDDCKVPSREFIGRFLEDEEICRMTRTAARGGEIAYLTLYYNKRSPHMGAHLGGAGGGCESSDPAGEGRRCRFIDESCGFKTNDTARNSSVQNDAAST